MADAKNDWFKCEIDRKLLKDLMRRSDRPALIHFTLHYGLLVGFGVAAWLSWGSWWFLPAYGGFCVVWAYANAIAHETCHGTPFRTRWMNELVLFIAGWMVQMEPVSVRWVHAGHHSHTSFEKEDNELILGNPVTWTEFVVQLLGLGYAHRYYVELIGLSVGHANEQIRDAIPRNEWPAIKRNARLYLASYAAIVVWAIAVSDWLPIVLFLLTRFVGAPVYGVMRVTQHTGLAMNVQDHRQTTRSFHCNRVIGFLYFNMNYHVEHHMFPLVPFYNLPRLHEAVKDQLPEPGNGFVDVYGEIVGAVARQQKDRAYYIPKALPDVA